MVGDFEVAINCSRTRLTRPVQLYGGTGVAYIQSIKQRVDPIPLWKRLRCIFLASSRSRSQLLNRLWDTLSEKQGRSNPLSILNPQRYSANDYHGRDGPSQPFRHQRWPTTPNPQSEYHTNRGARQIPTYVMLTTHLTSCNLTERWADKFTDRK